MCTRAQTFKGKWRSSEEKQVRAEAQRFASTNYGGAIHSEHEHKLHKVKHTKSPEIAG
jgi:hypothetical protein